LQSFARLSATDMNSMNDLSFSHIQLRSFTGNFFGGVGLIFLIGNYKINSKSERGNVNANTIREQQRNSMIFTRIVGMLLQEICALQVF
jgi:hypothetical protein